MPGRSIANVKMPIEIPLLCLFFAFIFSDSVKTNLIIFRTCYVTLGYNKSECSLLGSNNNDNTTADLEKVVEPYAAVLNMVHSLSDSFFSAIMCSFVGPWSDRFGRRPVLIVTVIGFMSAYVLYAVFAALDTISPWYSLLCAIPVYLTGGGSSYITVLLCYVTDITNESSRGLRMGIFEAILALGIFLGNVTSSYAFAATNYWTIFLISAACCFFNLIFTISFIPESVTNPESEARFKELFDLGNIKDMIQTTFKRRQNYDRYIILGCILMLAIYILVINGDSALIFLFLREKFHWSLRQYTLFSAAHNIVYVVGTVMGIYLLHKIFKFTETIMIIIGFASYCFGMIAMGFAQRDWQVYAACFSRALGGVISPMVRSLVSKILPNEEIGKVFALVVVSESLIGMGGSPIFTAVYNATISTDPGIFNFVGAGIYGLEIVIALGIASAHRVSRRIDYEEVVQEDDSKEQSSDITA